MSAKNYRLSVMLQTHRAPRTERSLRGMTDDDVGRDARRRKAGTARHVARPADGCGHAGVAIASWRPVVSNSAGHDLLSEMIGRGQGAARRPLRHGLVMAMTGDSSRDGLSWPDWTRSPVCPGQYSLACSTRAGRTPRRHVSADCLPRAVSDGEHTLALLPFSLSFRATSATRRSLALPRYPIKAPPRCFSAIGDISPPGLGRVPARPPVARSGAGPGTAARPPRSPGSPMPRCRAPSRRGTGRGAPRRAPGRR